MTKFLVRKFFFLFFLICLFFLLWSGIILIFLVFIPFGQDPNFVPFEAMGFFLIITLSFIPYMNVIAKKVLFFKGRGTPVCEQEIRRIIQEISKKDTPVVVKEKGKRIFVTWNYLDVTWAERMYKEGMRASYTLEIKFQEKRHLAVLIDIEKSISWKMGLQGKKIITKLGGGYFRGISFEVNRSATWTIKEGFFLKKTHEYRFTPGEIKHPIMNSLLELGWDVCFALW